jgi:prephenate dehydrogenase
MARPIQDAARKRKVHVVGAARGIGRWFVEHVFAHPSRASADDDCECLAYDRDVEIEALRDRVHCHLVLEGDASPFASIADHDIVVLAVPLDAMKSVLNDLIPYLAPDTLVVSFTSVQVQSQQLLANALSGRCQFLGCHPLFGPGLLSPVGAFAALVDYRAQKPVHVAFRNLLISVGLDVVELAAAEHDEAMAMVQSLTHFTLLTFASTLASLRDRPFAASERLARLRTPNFRFMHAFASRLLQIAPTTTGSVQLGEHASKVRSLFVEQAQQLAHGLDQSCDAHQAAFYFSATKRALRGPALADGADFAAQAVERLLGVEVELFQAMQSGRIVVLRHRVLGTYRLARIAELFPDRLRLVGRVGTKQVGGKMYLVPWLSPAHCCNYARQGLGDPRRAEAWLAKVERRGEVISRRHVEVMSLDFSRDFVRQNVLPARQRLVLPQRVRPLLRHLTRLVPEIWHVDEAASWQNPESLALDLRCDPAVDGEAIENAILAL